MISPIMPHLREPRCLVTRKMQNVTAESTGLDNFQSWLLSEIAQTKLIQRNVFVKSKNLLWEMLGLQASLIPVISSRLHES